MQQLIQQLCMLSLFCGTALVLAPEGSAKRMMQMVCSVLLLCRMLQPLGELDFESYRLELGHRREREALFLDQGQEAWERMQRSVIEQQCETYICDKAEALGVETGEVSVTARWSTEGFWLPYSAKLSCGYVKALSQYMEAELGIAEERQQWDGENG